MDMRAHGLVDSVPAAGPADHLCWVYDRDVSFDEAVGRFLAEGLARRERVLCVGDRVIESLRSLTGHDVAALIAGGAVETLTVAEAYEATGPLLPEQQLAYYDSATRRARDAGHRGLRVIAEVSALAGEPAQRAELVRWEHLADRYAARGSGFSAMCAYRADLAPEALADVACVHPLVHAPAELSAFRLFVDGDRLALAGSVDMSSSDQLARVLAAVEFGDAHVVMDLTELEFIDVAACRVLARWAAQRDARSMPVEVRGASALLRRMWQLLDLDRLAQVTMSEKVA
jgi:anti-anti-sigma factor